MHRKRLIIRCKLTGAGLGDPSSFLDRPRRIDVVRPDDDQLRHIQASQRLWATQARPTERKAQK